jgi:hypothetical protein
MPKPSLSSLIRFGFTPLRAPFQGFGRAFDAVAGDRRVALTRGVFVEPIARLRAANHDQAKGFPGLGHAVHGL